MGSDNESVSTLASESSVSEQTSRARRSLMNKRLRDKDRQISDKEVELMQLHGQLDAKDRVIQELSEAVNEHQVRQTQSEPAFTDLHTASQTQVVSFNNIEAYAVVWFACILSMFQITGLSLVALPAVEHWGLLPCYSNITICPWFSRTILYFRGLSHNPGNYV